MRNASAVSSASRYVGRTTCTLNTRSSDARMKAPATSPVMNGYSTMRMLHWSSTSFGYMNPCTPPMPSSRSANRAVEPVVVRLRARRHLRLQHVHGVRPQELVHRIGGVLQIGQPPRAGRARFDTRRQQPLRDPVVAERALVDRVRARIDEPRAVRARLDAVAAPEAPILVDEHHAVGADERRPDGTHLHARRIAA